jgi:hypothetical protein
VRTPAPARRPNRSREQGGGAAVAAEEPALNAVKWQVAGGFYCAVGAAQGAVAAEACPEHRRRMVGVEVGEAVVAAVGVAGNAGSAGR